MTVNDYLQRIDEQREDPDALSALRREIRGDKILSQDDRSVLVERIVDQLAELGVS